jgi:hypothetical protein
LVVLSGVLAVAVFVWRGIGFEIAVVWRDLLFAVWPSDRGECGSDGSKALLLLSFGLGLSFRCLAVPSFLLSCLAVGNISLAPANEIIGYTDELEGLGLGILGRSLGILLMLLHPVHVFSGLAASVCIREEFEGLAQAKLEHDPFGAGECVLAGR